MGFNFSKFKNLNVIKGKEEPVLEVSKEENLEDFMRSSKGSPIVKKEEVVPTPVVEPVKTVQTPVVEPVTSEPIVEDVKPEPIVEDIKPVPPVQEEEVTREVVTYANPNYSEYLREKLNISDSEDVDFYRPSILQCKPLDFSEIRDTKGIIKAKVADYELGCRLSCIPFKLIGLSNNIVEIKDYSIFTIAGEKYVSSSSRISNQLRMDEYVDRWKTKINSGEEIRESLIIEEKFEGKIIKTLAFNRKELDDLLSLFSKVNATLVSYTDDIKFVAGV